MVKRRLLEGVALAATLAAPVMAADMPVKAPPPPVPAYYDWSGAYLGASAGWISTTVDRTFPNAGVNPRQRNSVGVDTEGFFQGLNFSTKRDEAAFDVHLGAQEQWGWLVLGVEADAIACENECRSFTGPLLSPPFTSFGSGANTRFTVGRHSINWMYTVGGRVGIAWDTWMLYATGGGMYAGLHGTYCLTQNTAPFVPLCGPPVGVVQNGNSGNWGYYAGVGAETVLYKGPLVDVIGGIEYRHFDVGTKQAYCFNPGCAPVTGADYTLAMHGDMISARLSIKTHGWGFIWGP